MVEDCKLNQMALIVLERVQFHRTWQSCKNPNHPKNIQCLAWLLKSAEIAIVVLA